MEFVDYVIIGVIVLVIGAAVAYIIKAKRSGQKCIGCPDSKTCGKGNAGSACSGSCHGCNGSCHCGKEKQE
ncbi:MAG: FeoB-associated Cys-rich membrane protein [Ruminococcaceae bacterium]|nr:FeoB-associated Cys-rich membrane protein [Oscillospiraceae bacterium]